MAIYNTLQTYFPNFSHQFFVLIAIPIIIGIYYLSSRASFPIKAPKLVSHNYPIIGALGFFTERWTFCKRASEQSPTGNFSFHLGKHRIIGLSGEEARRVFFENKQLGLAEGYG
jgi:hypothetical protein